MPLSPPSSGSQSTGQPPERQATPHRLDPSFDPSNEPHVPPSVTSPSGQIIQVSPDVWDDGAAPTSMGGNEATAVLPVTMEKIEATMDALKPLTFLDGANGSAGVNQCIGALSYLGSNLQTVLACFATDLQVVSQGLTVAATAFANTDSQLTTTLQGLDAQLADYSVSQSPVTPPPATPAQNAGLGTTPLTFDQARKALPIATTPIIYNESDLNNKYLDITQ